MKIPRLQLTLRRRLWGAAGVTLMIVALAAVATVQFQRLGQETSRLTRDTDLYMGVSRSLEKATALVRIPSQAASGGGESLVSYEVRYDDLVLELEGLRAAAVDTAQAETLANVLESLSASGQAARRVFSKIANDQTADAIVDAMIAEELATDITASLRRMSMKSTEGLEARLETVATGIRVPQRILLGWSALIVALSLVMGYYNVLIVSPLERIIAALKQVQDGDLGARGGLV